MRVKDWIKFKMFYWSNVYVEAKEIILGELLIDADKSEEIGEL
jgi:hypothetical protein